MYMGDGVVQRGMSELQGVDECGECCGAWGCDWFGKCWIVHVCKNCI